MLASSLILPPWVESGVRPNNKGSRINKIIYGADSETLNGEPLTLQFYSEQEACDEIHFVKPKDARAAFLKWCAKRKADYQHVVYVHNLKFDLIEFLWGKHHKLIGEGGAGDFDFHIGKWHIKGVYGGPTFARISDGHHRTIYLIDSFSWFRGSLTKASALFCPHLPKLKAPKGLGSRRFGPSDTAFCEYAMRDAVVAYHIGLAIEKFHKIYEIAQAVSVADMAGKIFRKRFLTYEIPQPPRPVIDAAFASYHGGKNNLACEPGWHEGVNSIDISSAYPWAMRELPAYSNAKLYRSIKCKAGTRAVPNSGVYCVSGTAKRTRYPVLFTHGFKPLTDADVTRVWVQGYELNEAISSGEFKASRIKGYFYDVDRDHQAPALRAYVDDFYSRKEVEADPVLRYMYKTLLNSLYGKFIQTRKQGAAEFTDVDSGETLTASDLVAGGLFHPWMATEITARPRSRMHRMEVEWSAMHTATDGILSTRAIHTSKGWSDTKPATGSNGIGRITIEARDAEALIVRNKLYVLYGQESKKTTPSKVFKGKHIIKAALHGFQGNVEMLERMIKGGKRRYTVETPNTLKTAIARGATPNKFEKRKLKLNVGDFKHAA